MKHASRHSIVAGILALASHASAQVASVCQGDLCYKLNIPESTASSGNGDIFFQISAPSSYEWVALGQGSSMARSNMFVVYTSSSGNNVTLSPRQASGYTLPTFNSDAEVTLLEGSGVSNGQMIANVRCSNCNSWSGGTADFTSNQGEWVYAGQSSGGSKNSDDTNANIRQHNSEGAFRWNYANAKGGNSVNPLLNAQPPGTGGATGTSCVPRPANTGAATSTAAAPTATDDDDDNNKSRWGRTTSWPSEWRSRYSDASPTARPWDKRQEINYCDGSENNGITPIGSLTGEAATRRKMLIAHGVLAALAFVIFFPAGAIAIRLASFPGVIWFHAAFQIFAYVVYIVAVGLGLYLAKEFDVLSTSHPIIGLVLFAALLLQPPLGLLHHTFFKKHNSRTLWSYAHLWLGRTLITLGMINGGLGFRLARTMHMSSRPGEITYGVIAALVWLLYVAAAVLGERRRKIARGRAAQRKEQGDGTVGRPEDGHYAPKGR